MLYFETDREKKFSVKNKDFCRKEGMGSMPKQMGEDSRILEDSRKYGCISQE